MVKLNKLLKGKKRSAKVKSLNAEVKPVDISMNGAISEVFQFAASRL
jgi:hypothetical protein